MLDLEFDFLEAFAASDLRLGKRPVFSGAVKAFFNAKLDRELREVLAATESGAGSTSQDETTGQI